MPRERDYASERETKRERNIKIENKIRLASTYGRKCCQNWDVRILTLTKSMKHRNKYSMKNSYILRDNSFICD